MAQCSLDWWVWRPVVAGYGRLCEIQEEWSLDDLMDAHEMLAVQAKIQGLSSELAGSA